MNTYDDLRAVLKRMDNAMAHLYDVASSQKSDSEHALRILYEGFDDLCEYLLKKHAQVERLNSELALLKGRRVNG